MSDIVTFADDVALFLLDEGGVVLCERTQNFYGLNTTATFIWCCCEEGMTGAEIAASASQTFGISPADAEAYTRDIIEEWRGLGLLDGSRRTECHTPVKAKSAKTKDPGPVPSKPASSAIHSERSYRILGQGFRVRFTSAEQGEWVHPTLAHLESGTPVPGSTDLDIVADDQGYVLMLGSSSIYRCDALEKIAPLVKACLFFRSMEQESYFLAIHAAAVCHGPDCLLLPGSTGSGKTSLTTALIASGYHYLSDDIVLLGEETLGVRGLPLSLCVKDDGVESLRRYRPDLPVLAAHIRPDGKRVRYLAPTADALGREPGRSYDVRWIVFPRYQPENAACLKAIGKAEALRRLTALCGVPVPLDKRKVKRLVDWIDRVECFEMPLASLPEAIGLLQELCRRGQACSMQA